MNWKIFGESALFPGANGVAVRGATVTCVGNVQLLSLSKEKFDCLVESGSLNEHCLIKLRQVLKEHKEADLKKKKELRVKEGETVLIVKNDVAKDSKKSKDQNEDTPGQSEIKVTIPISKNLDKEKVRKVNHNNEKDHVYLRKKLIKLGRTKLEVIFKRVSPVGDINTIDRDGVLRY